MHRAPWTFTHRNSWQASHWPFSSSRPKRQGEKVQVQVIHAPDRVRGIAWQRFYVLFQSFCRCSSSGSRLLIHIFYLSTSLIDPGTPEPHASSLKGKWCTACKAPKPDRCHHCSTCRRCVLRMDHHCIFTNSCVGLRNQHFFLSFVSLTMFGAGASAVLAAPQVPSALLSLSLKHDVLRPIHLLVLCVTAAVACVCLWNLWMAHMHYLLRNETTIESLRNWSERCESPYDRGVVENVAEVFGPLAKSLPWTLGLLDALDHFLADEC